MPDIKLGRVRGADGIPGRDGTNGVTPNVQISNTTTLAAGAPAYFRRDSGSPDSSPTFSVGIPRGANGATPNIKVGNVTTVSYEAAADVSRRAGSSDVEPIFDFKIPAGPQGPQGREPAQTMVLTSSIELGPPHANKCIIVNSTNDVTLMILQAAYSPMEDNCEIEVLRLGSGAVTIKPSAGVTLLAKSNPCVISEQYSSAALKLLSAYDSTNNTWSVQGAIE
jgi:hypothetical protein